MRNSTPPQDHHRAQSMALLWCRGGVLFLMSEVPPFGTFVGHARAPEREDSGACSTVLVYRSCGGKSCRNRLYALWWAIS